MKNKSRFSYILILILCAVVFFTAGGFLLKKLISYRAAEEFYEDLSEQIPAEATDKMNYYLSLKKQYPNIIGYLEIDSVGIAYPVVQGEDNEYYTTHLVSGEENNSGAIFLDFQLGTDPAAEKNLILYGHNMNNKTMFHNIVELFDEETFYKTGITYVSDAGVFTYEPLAVYVTDTDDRYYSFDFVSDETFCAFFEERAALSKIPAKPYDGVSNLITLVTCSNSATKPNERYVFHGSMKSAVTDLKGADDGSDN